MVKGLYNTCLYDLKEEFVTSIDIAEVAFKEGNHIKAAYWIGQATVCAHIYGETANESDLPFKDNVGFNYYKKWALMRWALAN